MSRIILGLLLLALLFPPAVSAQGKKWGRDLDGVMVPGQGALRFSGSSVMKTDLFELKRGNYRITWTAHDPQPDLNVGCYFAGFLRGQDASNPVFEAVGNELVKGSSSGTTNAYGVAAGRYYLDMSSTCQWTVKISRR
jgi:hypothetical protein